MPTHGRIAQESATDLMDRRDGLDLVSGMAPAGCPFCEPDNIDRKPVVYCGGKWECEICGSCFDTGVLIEPIGSVEEETTSELKRQIGPRAEDISRLFAIDKVSESGTSRFSVGSASKGMTGGGSGEDHGALLYGIDRFASSKYATEVAYLVERELDVWAMTAAGLDSFSIPFWATSEQPESVLDRIRDGRIEKIVVIYDSDAIGIERSIDVAAFLRDAGVCVEIRQWPERYSRFYSIAFLWKECHYDQLIFKEALAKFQKFELPPTPPGGFWFPKVSGGAFIPPEGYVLSTKGVYKVEQDGRGGSRLAQIAGQPVWLEAHMTGLGDDECAVALATVHHGRVLRKTISRGIARNHSRLVDLAGAGFPVDSLNCRQLVAYLIAAEEMNSDTIPVLETVSRNGWHGKEFILGRSVLSRHGGTRSVEPSSTAGIDPQWFDCYRQGGSEEEWAEILPILAERPIALLGVAAALASPLLVRLDAPGYCLEWYGSSSGGKTTSLRCAMSVYGPCRLEDIPSWDNTQFAIEAQAAVRGNLPMVMDELKQHQGREEDTARIAYMLTSGQGRGRGNRDLGLQNTKTWRLVALWTGEHTVRDMTTDSGIHPRVLAFQGRPFGGPNEASRAAVERVEQIITNHYGHAGPRVIQYLLQLDEKGWQMLRAEYQDGISHLRKIAPEGVQPNFLDRWAKAFSTILLSARILADIYPRQLSREKARGSVESAWMSLCEQNAEETNYAEKALYHVMEWVASRASDFSVRPSQGDPTKRENLGRTVPEGLAIISGKLTKFLEDHGYSPKVVRQEWAAKNWILTNGEKPLYKNVRFDEFQARCIVITDKALALIAGEQNGDELPLEHSGDGGAQGRANVAA